MNYTIAHRRRMFVALLSFCISLIVCSQNAPFQWVLPLKQTKPAVHGRYWNEEIGESFCRLPQRAKGLVRNEVWNLSRQSAGLSIVFHSNSPSIVVQYTVKGNRAMPHMPATGVSGVDLYATDVNGKEHWCEGKYSFGDTITYSYENLSYSSSPLYEYQLFLPLYNEVAFLQIGTQGGSLFKFVPEMNEKPIVVYGTSIAQGACASRPGMAWTNIFKRQMETPVINLGFSGNGQLEKEMFDFLSEIDAQMYIIDCMPNMIRGRETLIQERVVEGVKLLRAKSDAPILLVEHDGYKGGSVSDKRRNEYEVTNIELRKAYETLQAIGAKKLFYLTEKELALSLDAQVDGIHPNDLGMMQYAIAYKLKVNEILHRTPYKQPILTPRRQYRDFRTYDWSARFNEVVDHNRKMNPEYVVIGNSIVHYWGGEPQSTAVSGKESWYKLFQDKKVVNMGCGWDKIENVVWRIQHGQLTGFNAKKIFLMIGTNNLGCNTDQEIVDGIAEVSRLVRFHQPTAHVYVVKILPRREQEKRIASLNRLLQKTLKQDKYLSVVDFTKELTQKNGLIEDSSFRDGLHPNEEGYSKIAGAMARYLDF